MLRLALLLALCAAPTLADPPARQLFGAQRQPVEAAAAAVGKYNLGCLFGAVALRETGPAWQAMRLSRNRNWGHPEMIAFIERLSARAQDLGWPRLLVGDISQPRGGPMLSGHRSHQMGLDADIWLTKPPERLMTPAEREKISALNMVARDRRRVSDRWTPIHGALLQAAAEDPSVARIFVNGAIKKQLCGVVKEDRAWLRKIRPWYGHDHHFHVRLHCPDGSLGCVPQAPIPAGDGCDETLDWWLSDDVLKPKPKPRKRSAPAKPRQQVTLADLPQECAKAVQ